MGAARATLPSVLSFGLRRWWLGLWGEVSAREVGWGTSAFSFPGRIQVVTGVVEAHSPTAPGPGEQKSTVGLTSECSGSLSPLACLLEAMQPAG